MTSQGHGETSGNNEINTLDSDIAGDDELENYHRNVSEDYPPLLPLSLGTREETCLVDSGSAYTFIGEELFNQLKETQSECIFTVIPASTTNIRYNLAAGNTQIKPKCHAVLQFEITRLPSEQRLKVETPISIITNLNRLMLIGRSTMRDLR